MYSMVHQLHKISYANYRQHGKGQSIGDRLIGIGTLVNEKQAIVLPILDEYVRIIEKNLWRSESFSEKLGYEVPEEYRTLRVALRDMVEEHLKRLGIDETAREGWLNDSHVKELPNLNNCRQILTNTRDTERMEMIKKMALWEILALRKALRKRAALRGRSGRPQLRAWATRLKHSGNDGVTFFGCLRYLIYDSMLPIIA
jgi:hypothetical protein